MTYCDKSVLKPYCDDKECRQCWPVDIAVDYPDISQYPEIDEYVKQARELLKGANYLYGTADYCLAGYLRIKDKLP